MTKQTKQKKQVEFIDIKKYKSLESKYKKYIKENQEYIDNLKSQLEIHENKVCECKKEKEALRLAKELNTSILVKYNALKEELSKRDEKFEMLESNYNRLKELDAESTEKYNELIKVSDKMTNMYLLSQQQLKEERDKNLFEWNTNSNKIANYEVQIQQIKSMSIFEFLKFKYAK